MDDGREDVHDDNDESDDRDEDVDDDETDDDVDAVLLVEPFSFSRFRYSNRLTCEAQKSLVE